MFCDNCGSENLETDSFCENCGKPLIDDKSISELNSGVIKDAKKKKFNIVYVVLFVLLVGEYFIYDANNELLSDIRYTMNSNNDIRNSISNIQEKRREVQRQLERESRQSYGSSSSSSSSYSGSGLKYGCKFYCTGSADMRRSSEFHVNTPASNKMDAENYIRQQYKSVCSKYSFYSGGGGSADVGYPRCETYYFK